MRQDNEEKEVIISKRLWTEEPDASWHIPRASPEKSSLVIYGGLCI